MRLLPDVNVIIARENRHHRMFRAVTTYLAAHKRRSVDVLAHVKKVFIVVYKKYLYDSALIIDYALNQALNNDTQTSNPFAVITYVQQHLDETLEELGNEEAFNRMAVTEFIDDLLAEYSIPELYHNPQARADFREEYTASAEQRAVDALNAFLTFFEEFEILHTHEYATNPIIWQRRLQETNPPFSTQTSQEDLQLAAELLSYHEKNTKAIFCTCDKQLSKALKTLKHPKKPALGRIDYITP